jgi:hypothetical protein
MLLLLIESNEVHEVMFYDTDMEFQSIYDTAEKVKPLLEEKGIKYTVLKPEMSFEYKMFEKPVVNRDGSGVHLGYSWCGGVCRWGTTDKLKALDCIPLLSKLLNHFQEVILREKCSKRMVNNVRTRR